MKISKENTMKKWILFLTLLFLAVVSFAQEFAIATNPYSQTYPETAFANNQYLTVFLDGKLIEETAELSYDIYNLIYGQTYLVGLTAVYDYLFKSDLILFNINFVGKDDELISTTKLLGNYPNPFNPSTTIFFSIEQNQPYELEIYNLKGEKIKTLDCGNRVTANARDSRSTSSIVWDGTDQAGKPATGGIYFYKLRSGSYTSTRKMILLK